MKGLMVTLLILSCTGMVCAQQDYSTGRRTGDVNNSSFNNQDPPIVPIVSEEGSSSAAISGTRDASTRTRNPLATSQGGAFGGSSSRSAGTTSSGSFGGSSSRSVEASSPSRSFGTAPNNRSLESSRGTDTPWANPAPVLRKNFPERETGLTQGVRRSATSEIATPSDDDVTYYLGLPDSQLANLQRFGSVEADVRNPYVSRITISDRNVPKATPVRNIEPVLQGDKLVFRFDEEQISHLADYSFEFNVPDYMKGKYSKAVIEYPPALQRITQTNPRAGSAFEADDRRWRLAGDRNPTAADTLELERKLALDRQYETERQRAEYERFQRERAAAQYAEQKRVLENREYEERLARLRFEQEQAASRARQTPLVSTAPLVSTTSTWPAVLDNRYADRRFDGMSVAPQPVVGQPVVHQSDALVASMMQNMMKTYENRVAQLSNEVSRVQTENEEFRRRFDSGYTYRTDLAKTGRVHATGAEIEPAPQIRQRTPLSTGRLDHQSGQVEGFKGMEGKTDSTRKQDSWNLLMFLMLLASVALNLYLWAVSRGFYMRYQELADELRETFAVTST